MHILKKYWRQQFIILTLLLITAVFKNCGATDLTTTRSSNKAMSLGLNGSSTSKSIISPTAPAEIYEKTTTINGKIFHDVFLVGPNGEYEIGVRKEWGGSVIYFGRRNDPASNVIDANDTGREFQLAFYDPDRFLQGCARDATCRTHPENACPNSMTFLGWDPVQGGNECNQGSPIDFVGKVEGGMGVRVRPLQWNPQWNDKTCDIQMQCGANPAVSDVLFGLDFKFINNTTVEVSMSAENLGDLNHAAADQEFPTLYVANRNSPLDLPYVWDAQGRNIYGPKEFEPGIMGTAIESSRWMAFTNNSRGDYGVGLMMEAAIEKFAVWGTLDWHSGRPFFSFGLPAKGRVQSISYLSLGSIDDIKINFNSILREKSPLGHLDTPTITNGILNEAKNIAGWALDNVSVAEIQVLVNDVVVTRETPNIARPDVCAVYVLYQDCVSRGSRVGFSIPLPSMNAGDHIRILAIDVDGNQTVLAEAQYQSQNQNQSTPPKYIGHVDGFSTANEITYLGGWACQDRLNESAEIQIYRNGDRTHGVLLTKIIANGPTENAVRSICNVTSGNYRFSLAFEKGWTNTYGGQPLYVYVANRNGNMLISEPTLKIPYVPQSVPSVGRGLIGHADGIIPSSSTSKILVGWACDKGSTQPVDIHVYMGGKAGIGVLLGGYKANASSEDAVRSICEVSSGQYRFSIPTNWNVPSGSLLYIYAVSSGRNILFSEGVLKTP